MTVQIHGVSADHQAATLIVAASDSLHPERADYVCGGADDQVQAQAAIAAAGDGEVYFSDGTYDFSGYIETTADGLTISGPGATLFLHASINGQLIRIGHDDITIRDITLDGNGGNQTSGNGEIEVTANSKRLTIDHVRFKNAWNAGLYAVGITGNNRLDGLMMSYCVAENFYNGITHQSAMAYISYANEIQIDHCVVDDFRHNANYADGVKVIHATNVQISHLLIINITGHGIFVGYGSEDVQMSNIIFISDVGYTLESICVEYAADGITNGVGRNKRVSISNVSHYATVGGNNGFYLETCDDLVVSNCIVQIDTVAMGNPHYKILHIDNGKFVNCTARGLISSDSSAFNVLNCDDVSLLNCSVLDSPVWGWASIPRGGVNVETSENTAITGCTFRDLATNGMLLVSSGIKINGCIFENMGIYAGWSAWCIHVHPNYDDITIIGNTFRVGAAAQTKGTYLESNDDDCIISNNMYGLLALHHLTGAGCDNLLMRNNAGYITEKSGTATLVSGTTSIAVTHGLSVTPAVGDIGVTPIEAWGNMTQFYIDTYTSTQFTIHANIDPGQDVDFAWAAIVL